MMYEEFKQLAKAPKITTEQYNRLIEPLYYELDELKSKQEFIAAIKPIIRLLEARTLKKEHAEQKTYCFVWDTKKGKEPSAYEGDWRYPGEWCKLVREDIKDVDVRTGMPIHHVRRLDPEEVIYEEHAGNYAIARWLSAEASCCDDWTKAGDLVYRKKECVMER